MKWPNTFWPLVVKSLPRLEKFVVICFKFLTVDLQYWYPRAYFKFIPKIALSMRLSFAQNGKVTWGQDQANTLDVHSLLLLSGQNSFTKCVTVVIYNPLTRERRFFLRHIRYRQSLKLVMDLKGRCHCRVYSYWWYPHIRRDALCGNNAKIRIQYLSNYRSLYNPWMTISAAMSI